MRIRLNNDRYTQIAAYVVATVFVILVLFAVLMRLDQIANIIKVTCAWIFEMLTPMIIGGLFACLLFPLVGSVERFLNRVGKIPGRSWISHCIAVAAVMLVMGVLIVLLVTLLLSVFTSTIRAVAPENVQNLADYVVSVFDNLYNESMRLMSSLGLETDQVNELIAMAQEKLLGGSSDFGSTVVSGVTSVGDFFSSFMFALIFCVYFLLDGENLAHYWSKALEGLLGKRSYGYFSTFVDDAQLAFTGYVRGQLIDATLMAVMVSLGLSMAGVRYAVVIGIATGVGNLIPYVGPIVSYVLTIAVCVVNQQYQQLIVAVIILLVVQVIDGQIINPKILSNSVELHPIVVIVALIIGGSNGGILGMFLAVPIASLVKIYFERLVAWREKKTAEQTSSQASGQ